MQHMRQKFRSGVHPENSYVNSQQTEEGIIIVHFLPCIYFTGSTNKHDKPGTKIYQEYMIKKVYEGKKSTARLFSDPTLYF